MTWTASTDTLAVWLPACFCWHSWFGWNRTYIQKWCRHSRWYLQYHIFWKESHACKSLPSQSSALNFCYGLQICFMSRVLEPLGFRVSHRILTFLDTSGASCTNVFGLWFASRCGDSQALNIHDIWSSTGGMNFSLTLSFTIWQYEGHAGLWREVYSSRPMHVWPQA